MEDRRKNGERRNFLMSDKDIAEWAGVSPNTVRYWRQTGVLPFEKVGKYPRVWYSTLCKVFRKPDKIQTSATGAGEAFYGTTQR
jgi:hypothetical protein